MSIAIEPAFAMGLFENIEAYPVVYYSTRSNIYPSLVFIKILLRQTLYISIVCLRRIISD